LEDALLVVHASLGGTFLIFFVIVGDVGAAEMRLFFSDDKHIDTDRVDNFLLSDIFNTSFSTIGSKIKYNLEYFNSSPLI
jgi:hypothetical protein